MQMILLAPEQRELRRDFPSRETRLQSPPHAQPADLARLPHICCLERVRRPGARVINLACEGWGDANDGHRLIIEASDFPNNLRVRRKAGPPEALAHYHDGIGSCAVYRLQ